MGVLNAENQNAVTHFTILKRRHMIMTISRLDLRILVVLLIIPLILITASSAFAGGNPPGEGEKASGPVVSGVLILFPSYAGRRYSPVEFFFTSGKCKGEYVTMAYSEVFVPNVTFDFVNELNLPGTRWDTIDLPPGCSPDPSAELVIRKVKNFVDLDPALIKIAEIEMIFVY